MIPDENDAFSYRQLLMQLVEMKDQVETDDIVTLLTKVVGQAFGVQTHRAFYQSLF